MAGRSGGPSLEASRLYLSKKFPSSGALVGHPSFACFSSGSNTPVISSEGQQLRYCGSGFGYDDVIIMGDPDDMKVRLANTAGADEPC
jgi:hypothetical protein